MEKVVLGGVTYYKVGDTIPVADGIKFYHTELDAIMLEKSWARTVQHYRYNENMYPNGYHHMGMHWSQIYFVVRKELYKPGVLRVAHFKLGPKNITCLRKERLPSGKIRWVKSYHWEGYCPGCQKPSLSRPGPVKLIRRNVDADRTDNETRSEGNPDNSGRPKLIRRK